MEIQFIIKGDNKISIVPLLWYLLPKISTNYTVGTRKDYINIHPDYNTRHPRKFSHGVIIMWLCFRLQFIITKLTEVGELYPSNYEWGNDPKREQRYKDLELTGYFS